MRAEIAHLYAVPAHAAAVAELIHDEFWITVPGASADGMRARIEKASQPDRIPLCLVAVNDGEAIGAVNLVDNDDDSHPEWRPWVAGVVVARDYRRRGVGSSLMRALLAEARRMGLKRLYFGTDGPDFYRRLGAVDHAPGAPGFHFMRFELDD